MENIKYVPEGTYKEALQKKYKKMELIEKGVITAILVGVVFFNEIFYGDCYNFSSGYGSHSYSRIFLLENT